MAATLRGRANAFDVIIGNCHAEVNTYTEGKNSSCYQK